MSIIFFLFKQQLIDEKSFWCASRDLCLFFKNYSFHLVYQLDYAPFNAFFSDRVKGKPHYRRTIFLNGEFSVRQAQRKVVKIKKSRFFLLGLKYTLRTCFKSKNILLKSCPELSNQVHTQFFSLSNLLVVSKACAMIRFQLFDI